MGKIQEHSIQKRQKCVDLHKSGNGYKKIAARLKMAISTVRAIMKKFKHFNIYHEPACKRTQGYF